MSERLTYDLDDVSDMLGVPLWLVRCWARARVLPVTIIDGHYLLVPADALRQWVQQNTIFPENFNTNDCNELEQNAC